MIVLIIGGSGSGKSVYAENMFEDNGMNNYYIATMQPYDNEAYKKIDKHINQRKNKNFKTIEKYTDINDLIINKDSCVLLDCMSNLVANEMFINKCNANEIPKKIVKGILKLSSQCNKLVIVTNDVFSDGVNYDNDTLDYIKALADTNCKLADIADNVIECVYGIPVFIKKQ